jgi:hypothetical protein
VCAAFLELLPADCENGLQKDYLAIALEGVYSWRRRQEKVHRVRVKDIRLSSEGDLRSTNLLARQQRTDTAMTGWTKL